MQEAGWFVDPGDRHNFRYWDGVQWTAHTAPRVEVAPKNPAVSLLVSFFLPGVGSMMNGDVENGVAILVIWVVSLPLALVAFVGYLTVLFAFVWGLIDAYRGARRWNARHGFIS